MAGNPTFEVMATYAAWLRPLMPVQPQPVAGQIAVAVPVFYGEPSDRFAGSAVVWFGNITDSYQTHSLRANVRRRQVTSLFEIVISCVLVGKTDEVTSPLQQQADQFVHDIEQIIDLDIATHPSALQQPAIVDHAFVRGGDVERGVTDQGVGCRRTLRIEFETRFIT